MLRRLELLPPALTSKFHLVDEPKQLSSKRQSTYGPGFVGSSSARASAAFKPIRAFHIGTAH